MVHSSDSGFFFCQFCVQNMMPLYEVCDLFIPDDSVAPGTQKIAADE